MQLVVIAQEPIAGLVKTHLCPPGSPEEAAAIADGALVDTLATVAATPASRRIIALDGRPGPWVPDGFDVLEQRGGGLANRLFGAFEDCFHVSTEPVVLIGTDTPQVTPAHLEHAAMALETGADAVMGLTTTAGYWLIALRHLHPAAFAGVPMGSDDTGEAQLERLRQCGYRVRVTDQLHDIGDARDAVDVAALVRGSQFAAAVEAVFGPPDH